MKRRSGGIVRWNITNNSLFNIKLYWDGYCCCTHLGGLLWRILWRLGAFWIYCVLRGGGSIIDMVMECGSERWDEKMIKKNEKKG